MIGALVRLAAYSLRAVAGTLLILAVAIPALQTVEWLRTGTWQKISLIPLLGPTAERPTDWIGLNRLVVWALDTHPSLFIVAFAASMFWLMGKLWDSKLWPQELTAQEASDWANREGPYACAATLHEALKMKERARRA